MSQFPPQQSNDPGLGKVAGAGNGRLTLAGPFELAQGGLGNYFSRPLVADEFHAHVGQRAEAITDSRLST